VAKPVCEVASRLVGSEVGWPEGRTDCPVAGMTPAAEGRGRTDEGASPSGELPSELLFALPSSSTRLQYEGTLVLPPAALTSGW
jgi:hypothetical protein